MLHDECWNDENYAKVDPYYTYIVVIIILLLYLYHTYMLSFISIRGEMWWFLVWFLYLDPVMILNFMFVEANG